MRRSPSIVPEIADRDIYLVLDDFGRLGRAWRETNEGDTDREAVITDLMEGQYFDPARIVAFNTAKGWSRDVSKELANEVAERLAVERRDPCGTKQNVYISYSFFDALESSMQSPFREPCASPTAST